MAEVKRTKEQREADLERMSVLVVQGATVREVAAAFGLSVSVAHRDIKEIERRWQKRAADRIDAWKGRIMAAHERVIAEAWREWERSKLDAESEVETTELPPRPKADGLAATDTAYPDVLVLTRRVKTREGRLGDPRYLGQIETALAEQAKVIGLHAPVKAELTAPVPVQVIEIVPPEAPGDASP